MVMDGDGVVEPRCRAARCAPDSLVYWIKVLDSLKCPFELNEVKGSLMCPSLDSVCCVADDGYVLWE